MNQKRAGHANRCKICRINYHFCVCKALKTMKIETNLSFIVHVSELKLTSNTASLAKKVLPENAELFVRGAVEAPFTPEAILKRPGRPLFLYPSDESVELNDEFVKKYPGPYHLIIPDGNWTQARKVKARVPEFHDLPAVRLPKGIFAEYKLRKAPQPEWVSTYEAAAHSLAILEKVEIKDFMMDFFRIWVQATLNSRSGNFSLAHNLVSTGDDS